MNSRDPIDRRWIRRSFDRAAAHYDTAAVLQREVADRLLERLELIRLQPAMVLDVGSGTGYASGLLRKRYPASHVVELDFAPAMLRQARAKLSWLERWRRRRHPVCGDAMALPLADTSVDMIFSSLALQWCNDLDRVFTEFRRVLKPGGLLMFATLGPDTLKELRASWARVDRHPHVSPFLDMHDIGDALVRARLADPVMDVEHLCLTYTTVHDLMRDLKTLGSRNATHGRHTAMTGRQRLQAMTQAYEDFRRDGVLPATYEVAYGHAWAPEPDQRQRRAEAFPIPVRQQQT